MKVVDSIRKMSDNNIIIKLIEKKMAEDKWTAYTPDSYAGYLFQLTDEEIMEELEQNKDL